MGAIAETMRRKLTEALAPNRLEIVDDSARHAGHAGTRAGGESHFTITIEAAAFTGLRRIQRQRLIHAILAEELAGPVHALSLKTSTPGET
jgi:BolA family transcriptional regulator, general stress-responsive regulator